MQLEQILVLVEQQLAQVTGNLLANDALALERSSAGLRQAVTHFAEAIAIARRQQALSPALLQRMQDITTRLGAHRPGLARLAAATARLPPVLVPTAPDSPYGRAVGVRSVSGPGARIYSSAYAH
mgnify:CR=1 FL=1